MFLAPIVLAAALIHAAASEGAVPNLDVRPSCNAASTLIPEMESSKGCLRDEAQAKTELGRKWSTYPVSERTRCTAEVHVGGDPSYVELLVCLDLGANRLPERSGGGLPAGATR